MRFDKRQIDDDQPRLSTPLGCGLGMRGNGVAMGDVQGEVSSVRNNKYKLILLDRLHNTVYNANAQLAQVRYQPLRSSSPPLLLCSTPPPSFSIYAPFTSSAMPDPAAKTKHAHAASHSQPAPRRVRFNVGQSILSSCLLAIVLSKALPMQVRNTKFSTSLARVRTVSYALRSTGQADAKSRSRRSHPLTIPCSA